MPIPARFQTLALLLAVSPADAFAATLDVRTTAASEEVFRGLVQNNSLTGMLRADVRFAGRAFAGGRVLNNRSAGGAQFDVHAGYARSALLFDLIPVSVDGGVNVSVYGDDRRGPQQRDLDWAEVWLAAGSGPLRATIAFAPDYFGTGAVGWRAAGQLRWPISAGFDATAVLAWNDGDGVRRHTAVRGGGAAYADYNLSLSKTLPKDLTLFAQFTGASQTIDDSARPRLLAGIRWRWGRQW